MFADISNAAYKHSILRQRATLLKTFMGESLMTGQ